MIIHRLSQTCETNSQSNDTTTTTIHITHGSLLGLLQTKGMV